MEIFSKATAESDVRTHYTEGLNQAAGGINVDYIKVNEFGLETGQSSRCVQNWGDRFGERIDAVAIKAGRTLA